MKTYALGGAWTLSGEKIGTVSATVPGCVHTDLQNNGLLGDIFWRDNSRDCQWIEECDWDYSCTFSAPPVPHGEEAFLVFEGLDVYAEITLNGVKIGETDDMFIPYRFEVSGLLSEQDNVLKVHFRSPVREVADKPLCRGAFAKDRMYTRRIQCTYGWDWVDRFVTCGIWRPVYLAYSNGIDVESTYIQTESIDSFSAQIYTEINFERLGNGSMAEVEILAPDGTVAEHARFFANLPKAVRRFDLPNPRLWYPRGYGEQPLYTLRITVGENVHEEKFGIRLLKILQLRDAEGSAYHQKALEIQSTKAAQKLTHDTESSGFFVLVNGKPIFCMGGNWVPCEPFPSAQTEEQVSHFLDLACRMGVNTLRVWGGGVFESSFFYDECDRLGILVIQDFMMACGNYPEKEPSFAEAITREAQFAVKALRNHPSLAWWQGDNENAMKANEQMEDYNGRDSALRVAAPQIVQDDRFRVFLPSSPYGGNLFGSLISGTSHVTNFIRGIFNYFHEEDCTDYKEFMAQFVSRFCVEDGTFGAVNRSSMLKFMSEDDLLNDPTEAMIFYHSKHNPDLDRHFLCDIIEFTRKILGEFENAEDRLFKYRYIQYEWVRVVFENIRKNLGYSNGMLFWMYNDCWPAAMGWSFVDYYGLPKASYYSFKRCSAPLIGSVSKKDGRHSCILSSADGKARSVVGTAYLLGDDCSVLESASFSAEMTEYGTREILLPWSADTSCRIVCDVHGEDGEDRCFAQDGALRLRPCSDGTLDVTVEENRVTLHASSYVHVVELDGADLFEENYFSLLPGESKTVCFQRGRLLSDSAVTVRSYTLQ